MPSKTAPALRGFLTILGAVLSSVSAVPTRADDARSLSAIVRDAAPALAIDRLDGSRLRLEDGHGRVRLVHFFATWCEPCRPELASLDALRADRSGDGLDILAISVAEPEMRLRRYFAENPTGLMVLLDRDRAASRAWGIEALPSSIVVDREGRSRLAVRGDLDWGRPDVRAALDAMLAETSSRTITTGGNRP